MRKIFKVIGWFFSIAGKYDKAKRRYEKEGWIAKSFALLIIPAFLALGVVSAYGTAWFFKSISFESFRDILFVNILKIIAGLILGYIAIGITFKGFVILIQHAIIAFVCASGKKTIFEKLDDKVEETVENIAENSEDDFIIDQVKKDVESVKEKENKEKKKSSRGFDIFYGIISLVYAVALIGAVVVVCIIA